MNRPKWKHRPCPCGCGELADECMSPRAGLSGAFQIREPAPWPHDVSPARLTAPTQHTPIPGGTP